MFDRDCQLEIAAELIQVYLHLEYLRGECVLSFFATLA